MDASSLAGLPEIPAGPSMLVAAGLFARIGVAIETCAHGILPTVEVRSRLALGLLVSLAALPAAVAASPLASTGPESPWVIGVIAGEACLGLCLGLTVAGAVSAVAWAGDLLGHLAGMAWEDGEEEDAGGSTAGIARLARWLALGGFVAAGGLEVVLLALTDGVRTLPIGALSAGGFPTSLEAWALRMPAWACGWAVSLAVPTMAAVLVFQLAAVIALRASSCDPGPGILHAATALVVLAMIVVHAGSWSRAAGPRLLPTLSAALAPQTSAAFHAEPRRPGDRP